MSHKTGAGAGGARERAQKCERAMRVRAERQQASERARDEREHTRLLRSCVNNNYYIHHRQPHLSHTPHLSRTLTSYRAAQRARPVRGSPRARMATMAELTRWDEGGIGVEADAPGATALLLMLRLPARACAVAV